MKHYTATREIGIDAGHRVPDHKSKCKNIHGHRYTIQATVAAPHLVNEGEQRGMVLDFGFLKRFMMDEIDVPCDHGLILSVDDPIFSALTGLSRDQCDLLAKTEIVNPGYYSGTGIFGKLYVISGPPTAENLAAHWYSRLGKRIEQEYPGQCSLTKVKVWETPNCSSEYPAII